jgi:hypothetical protein
VAWTNPKTWSFGEILTSTDMNTYVRDNTDDLDTRVSALLAGGIGSNIATATVVDNQTTSSSTYVGVPGMSVTITPTSTSSRVLVVCHFVGSAPDTAGDVAGFRIVRGSTALGVRAEGWNYRAERNSAMRATFVFLDSPGTDTATTYGLEFRAASGTGARLNGAVTISNQGVSGISAIEVAG